MIYLFIFVWCPRQNKRIAPLSFFHGCRKMRLNVVCMYVFIYFQDQYAKRVDRF
jgi:hypothetical protein